MKKIILYITFILTFVFTGKTQEVIIESGPLIEFEKKVHDYGKVEYDGNPECTFLFKNTGTEPLIISKAKGSCGCTIPEWPKNPIPPGSLGEIRVKYDTKRLGPINKVITISSNALNTEEGICILRIKGDVVPKVDDKKIKNN